MTTNSGPAGPDLSEKEPIGPEVTNNNSVVVGDEKIEASNSRHSSSITRLDSHIVKVDEGAKEEDPLDHLPPDERAIIKRQLDMPEIKLNYFTLFRFATRNDLILIFTAALASIIAGAVMPLMTIVFGELAGVFQEFALGTITPDDMQSELNRFTMYVNIDRRPQFLPG